MSGRKQIEFDNASQDGESHDSATEWLPANRQGEESFASYKPHKEQFKPSAPQEFHPYRSPLLLRLWLQLASILKSTLDPDAVMVLRALALAIGIIAYHFVPEEPMFYAVFLVSIIAWGACIRLRHLGREGLAEASLLIAMFLTGLFLAQHQLLQTDVNMLSKQVSGKILASVIEIEDREAGERLDLRVHNFSALPPAQTPQRVRLSNRSSSNVKAGDVVHGVVQLMPHSGPAYPGGYDFAFRHFFEERGAIGFSFGKMTKTETRQPERAQISWRDKFKIMQSNIRYAIGARIDRALEGQSAALAKALLIGHRQQISDETAEWLRTAGLAHILAISGLHMSLLAGTVLFGVRLAMAWHGTLALFYPSKKLAACISLIFVAAYLVISGASLATQRAFITIAVMLVAMLLDRRALSLRNVSIAAIIILAIQPSAIFEAGFHMSFAAVGALVAANNFKLQSRNDEFRTEYSDAALRRLLRYCLKFLLAIALTSLIAGLASGIFAAWHFQRIAPISLMGNILALPIITLIVMPSLLFSMILTPFGIGALPLKISGWGIDQVLSIAHWISQIGPQGYIGLLANAQMFFLVLSLLVFICFHHWKKLFALVFIAIAILPNWAPLAPDVLISQDRKLVAVKFGDVFAFNTNRRDRFTKDIWLKAFAPSQVARTSSTQRGSEVMKCDEAACIAQLPNGDELTWVKSPNALIEACHRSRIVVAPFPLSTNTCGAEWLIDQTTSQALGAVAIELNTDGSLKLTTAQRKNSAIAHYKQ